MKPILFNTEMVRAILDGRKTATRRTIKRTPSNDSPSGYGFWKEFNERDNAWYVKDYTHSACWYQLKEYIKRFSKYQVGDIIYARETWQQLTDEFGIQTIYRANEDYSDIENLKWRPSLHMPKSEARIFLKVTDVRVERLQDITEEQAKEDGIRGYSKDGNLYKYCTNDDSWMAFHSRNNKKLNMHGNCWQDMPRTAKEAFMYLWNSTIKKMHIATRGWEANPFVWVIEFERCEKPRGGGK